MLPFLQCFRQVLAGFVSAVLATHSQHKVLAALCVALDAFLDTIWKGASRKICSAIPSR